MNAQEIMRLILQLLKKKTPVKVYVKMHQPVTFGDASLWQRREFYRIRGLGAVGPHSGGQRREDHRLRGGERPPQFRSPPAGYEDRARIEPGAIIREKVEIGEGAIIMMGAHLERRRWWAGAP